MMDIKPCPFCGGVSIETDYEGTDCCGNHFAHAYCIDCGTEVKGDPEKSKDKAVDSALDAWNRRAERTCHYVYDKENCAWRCSECGGLEPVGDHVRYCPDCGARVVDE